MVGGPTVVDGVTFFRVKRCPLCDNCNIDPNPILGSGPFGNLTIRFLVWARGTSTNPVGRYCKICWFVWIEGAFSAEYPDTDHFLGVRKSMPQVHEEWNAAVAVASEILAEVTGDGRIGKVSRATSAVQLQGARKEVVEVYNTSQIRVGQKFRGVDAKEYEKRHPGRIVKKKWTVKEIKTKQGIKDMVLIPRNEQDEFDITIEEISGTTHKEIHEEGDQQLRKGQAAAKFIALASDARNTVTSNDNLAGEQELDGESEEERAPSQGSHAGSADASSDDGSEEQTSIGMVSSLWLGEQKEASNIHTMFLTV